MRFAEFEVNSSSACVGHLDPERFPFSTAIEVRLHRLDYIWISGFVFAVRNPVLALVLILLLVLIRIRFFISSTVQDVR